MLRLLLTIAFRAPARWVALVFAALLYSADAAGLSHVTLILSEPSGAYREVADAIAAKLRPAGIQVASFSDTAQLGKTDLVVAIGAKATQMVAALDPPTPVLSTLVPRQLFEQIANRNNGRFSAVVLDQPLSRQLRLVRAALPQIKRVGAILGPDSAPLAPALVASARELGLEMVWQKIESQNELPAALEKTLSEAEVLLALPDRVVSSRNTLHNLLLTSYRYQDPVVGYSAAYGKAGALLTIYTTPAQAAQQTAEMILDMVENNTLPPVSTPKYFSVDVNSQVARSLGLIVPDGASLMESLKP